MRFCSIASGSSGNCIYVGSDTASILVDAGISAKKTIEGLRGLDVAPEDIDAIFVTHEHSDHIKGISVLARKYNIPIYATNGTIQGIKSASGSKPIDDALFNIVKSDTPVSIKDLLINPMHISHDVADPVAYRVFCEGKKAAVVTDLGNYDDYTIECLRGMDILMAEANHDVRMLQVGPYPYYLKQRILSDRGHLSNDNSGRMISSLLHDEMKAVILGHLSLENNLPELAYETVRLEIEAADNKYHGGDFPILVAKRDCPMAPIEI